MASGKTTLYIDNSNIFRGCKRSGWRPSYRKVRDFLESTQGPLGDIHFFASEQESPREKQSRFYSSLKEELGFSLHTFRLAHRKVSCPGCGHEEWIPAEKGVDVGLVTQLLKDLRNDRFETALVMSSDRDYLDAILLVMDTGRKVKIVAWRWTLPPDSIQVCQHNNIDLVFLEDFRDQLEKPQGAVL